MSMFEEADVLIWVNFSGAAQCRDQLCIWSENPPPASNKVQASLSVLVSLPFDACLVLPNCKYGDLKGPC